MCDTMELQKRATEWSFKCIEILLGGRIPFYDEISEDIS